MKKFSRHDLKYELNQKLIEQEKAVETFLPYLTTYFAGLGDETRPIGCFLLLGSTGCGKTYSIEALAEVLHGDASKIIKVDCGQFTQSHEVAKLLGSPPGYLGHRETQPFFNTTRFENARSKDSDITLVLFDEVEKAHFNMFTTLLSVMDKGNLSLGDNSQADFRKSMVFFTSNLGAKDMMNIVDQKLGFVAPSCLTESQIYDKMDRIGIGAVKKKFTPEWFNRLNEVITYKPLSKEAIKKILGVSLKKIHDKLAETTKPKPMYLLVTDDVEKYLIEKGFSDAYGARELNRVVQRKLVQPLADLVVETEVKERLIVRTKLVGDEIKFELIPPRLFEIEVKE